MRRSVPSVDAITLPSKIRLESARLRKIGLFTFGLYVGAAIACSQDIEAAVWTARKVAAHEIRTIGGIPDPPRQVRRVARGPKRTRMERVAVLPTYDVKDLPVPTFDVAELPVSP